MYCKGDMIRGYSDPTFPHSTYRIARVAFAVVVALTWTGPCSTLLLRPRPLKSYLPWSQWVRPTTGSCRHLFPPPNRVSLRRRRRWNSCNGTGGVGEAARKLPTGTPVPHNTDPLHDTQTPKRRAAWTQWPRRHRFLWHPVDVRGIRRYCYSNCTPSPRTVATPTHGNVVNFNKRPSLQYFKQ